jgi:hypothetical protein
MPGAVEIQGGRRGDLTDIGCHVVKPAEAGDKILFEIEGEGREIPFQKSGGVPLPAGRVDGDPAEIGGRVIYGRLKEPPDMIDERRVKFREFPADGPEREDHSPARKIPPFLSHVVSCQSGAGVKVLQGLVTDEEGGIAPEKSFSGVVTEEEVLRGDSVALLQDDLQKHLGGCRSLGESNGSPIEFIKGPAAEEEDALHGAPAAHRRAWKEEEFVGVASVLNGGNGADIKAAVEEPPVEFRGHALDQVQVQDAAPLDESIVYRETVQVLYVSYSRSHSV